MQALRQLLGLLAQLVLLARQPFELSLQLLRVESFAIPLQVTLLAIERILTPRELTDPLERIVLLILSTLFSRIRSLVVGFLTAAQLVIEQTGKIRFGAIRPSTSAGLLRSRDLSPPDLRCCFQQLIERLHLVRKRGARTRSIELADGTTHRLERKAKRVVTGR